MLNKIKQPIVLITGIVLVIFGLLALYYFNNPSNSHYFPKCIFYATTGLQCPGCGTQRAVHFILQGQIITGLKHNPLLILLPIVLGYKAFIVILNKVSRNNYTSLLNNSIVVKFILAIIILYWILRNTDVYPFI